MGIYRSSPAGGETIAYNVKGLDLSYGSSASAAQQGAPTVSDVSSSPIPDPTETSLPDTNQTAVPGNTLIGTRAGDTIIGTAGDDKLFGKAGTDLLTGGEGKDIFAFDTRPDGGSRIDMITDFNVDEDMIQLDDAIFASLPKGQLGEGSFRIGKSALDRSDHILYDRGTGIISYDADGSGSAKAVAFAKVTPGLDLTYEHFFIV
jgi:Ca2+-binding RTX toxin-like protein